MQEERVAQTYPAGRSERAIDIKEADGVLERTILKGRVAGSHLGTVLVRAGRNLGRVVILTLRTTLRKLASKLKLSGGLIQAQGREKLQVAVCPAAGTLLLLLCTY